MTGYPKKRRFLSLVDLDDAAIAVSTAAKRQGIKTAVVGGYACQLYGSDRLTTDLDMIASGPIKGFPVGKRLAFGGYQTRTKSGVPVDVIIRDDDYAKLYAAALRTAVKDDPLSIVRVEYLAAMKLASARGKDNLDLKYLITEAIGLNEARAVIKKYLGSYAADEFDRIVDEANWEKQRGR